MTAPATTALLCLVCKRRDFERAHVCEADRVSIPATLDAIRELRSRLGRTDIAPGRRGEAVKVSGGNVDPAAPINLDVIDLAAPANGFDATTNPNLGDQIGHPPVDYVLRAWCREFRRWRGNTERFTGGHLHWLAERTDWACDAYPHIANYVAAIRKLEATLTHVTGYDLGDTISVGPCPMRCGGTLYANPWQDSAECPKCKQRWHRSQWGTLTRKRAAA